jgi:hypothetical protein
MANNFKTVLEFNSLLEGYNHCRTNGPNPFVVRNCLEFCTATPQRIQSQMNLELAIHGYNATGTHEVSGRQAYESWLNDTLDFNIVDSSSSRGCALLPLIIRDLNIANCVDSMVWFSYVLTLAAVQSKCHIDPPFGSGWQFLSVGNKEWTIIDKSFFSESGCLEPRTESPPPINVSPISNEKTPHANCPPPLLKAFHLTTLFDTIRTARFAVLEISKGSAPGPGNTISSQQLSSPPLTSLPLPSTPPVLPPSEVLDHRQSVRSKFPGCFLPSAPYDMEAMAEAYPDELYRVSIGASDFISCPQDWPHSVLTTRKTCGLSGYMKYENPS